MQIPKISLCICALLLGATRAFCVEDTASQAAARQTLEQKVQELEANSSAATTPASAAAATPAAKPVTVKEPAPANSTVKTAGLTKEEKLIFLLGQYRADMITPQEYHQKRAAILAEP